MQMSPSSCLQETYRRVDAAEVNKKCAPSHSIPPKAYRDSHHIKSPTSAVWAPPVAGHSWLWEEWPISMLHTPVHSRSKDPGAGELTTTRIFGAPRTQPSSHQRPIPLQGFVHSAQLVNFSSRGGVAVGREL